MVAMALADKSFDAVKTAMEAGVFRAAFEAAHALKGSIGNVALTLIFEPVCALTELLGSRGSPVNGDDALLKRL